MATPGYFVTCPTCKAEPGEDCHDDGEGVPYHSDRIRHDEIEIRLTLSKAAAYRLAQMIILDDEMDQSLYLELQDADIILAQASSDVWCHAASSKQ